jgi:hypothetical protein
MNWTSERIIAFAPDILQPKPARGLPRLTTGDRSDTPGCRQGLIRHLRETILIPITDPYEGSTIHFQNP